MRKIYTQWIPFPVHFQAVSFFNLAETQKRGFCLFSRDDSFSQLARITINLIFKTSQVNLCINSDLTFLCFLTVFNLFFITLEFSKLRLKIEMLLFVDFYVEI
jgi:hypothetical protein